MTERKYSSIAGTYALTSSVSSSATSLDLSLTAGLPPAFPFTLVLDPGTTSEEIVTVTAMSGTSVTVIRGEDGSSGQTHQTGAVVRHMASARDFREPQQHIAASVAHGASSTLVGVSDTQTLENKTLGATTQVVVDGSPVALSTALSGAGTSMAVAALAHNGAKLATSGAPAKTVWASGDVAADQDGLWSAASPTRLTVKTPGTYLVLAAWSPPALASGTTSSTLYRNGAPVAGSVGGASGTSISGAKTGTFIFPLALSTGDYVEALLDVGSDSGTPYTYSLTLMQIG